jgi:predicted nucleic acid-binding protein
MLKRVAAERGFWALMDVSGDVLAAAETLAAAHPLRALDAIHVASAQVLAGRIGDPTLVFVTADARQSTAATAAGMTGRLVGS